MPVSQFLLKYLIRVFQRHYSITKLTCLGKFDNCAPHTLAIASEVLTRRILRRGARYERKPEHK